MLLAPLLLERAAEGGAAGAVAALRLGGALQPQPLLADLHLPRHRQAPLLPRAAPHAPRRAVRRRRLRHPAKAGVMFANCFKMIH